MQLSGFQRQVTSSRQTLPVEDLEQQVTDTTSNLDTAETRKKELESELKNTVEKVWVLTDIINKLENQLVVKSKREECLEKRLDELEDELEHQSIAQQAMAQEMESLKSREESEENCMEQIAALQEEMKLQYSSNSIRNIKAQLREIEKGIESRTKELEGLNLNSSTTSLSSPSEEISIREHLEMIRCQTPEFCPSPVALPVEEVNKLQDKIHRHIRSEEMIIKKVKDQDLQIKKLSHVLGEVQAEREVLQQTVEKLNVQLGRANTKVDELRRKAETAHSSANQALSEKISHLEQYLGQLKLDLDQAQTQLQQKEEQINRAKELIDEQNVKLRNFSQANPEIVQALRLELAGVMTEKNKLEELVDKYKTEAEAINMSPLYSCLLNDKNEDIQQLQRTVSLLQSQQCGRRGGDFDPSVVGKTVSFVDELSPIGHLASPLREVHKSPSYSLNLQPYEFNKMSGLVPSSEIQPQPIEPTFSSSSTSFNLNPAFVQNEISTGEEKITKLETEVKSLQSLIVDLTDAKKDVESYISSFTDDRKYYESQLNKLLDEKKSQEDEIEKLRQTLEKKDNEIKNTTADVTKLQVILSNLQDKLKQASKFASKDNELKKELSEMKEKCSTLEDVLEQFYKFRDELGSINEDFKYRENSDDYFQNILDTLRQKLRKTTDIELSNSNLKRQNDDLKNEILKLKQENDHFIEQVNVKRQEFSSELLSMKSEMEEINFNNGKLKSELSNYLQLKQDNIDMLSKIEQLELCKNLMEVELSGLKSENNKMTEELECIKTELKFKNINNNYEDSNNEKDAVDAGSTPNENEHVADLEDLTYEIEKQLDLSAKLDNSLLNTIGEKSYYKKEPTISATSAAASLLKESSGGSGIVRQVEISQPGLVSWLAKEVNAWQSAGSKQNQLASQLNNLSRLVQTQDNRITRLLVELDGKKKECLVMELDLLRERSNVKQVQCLLETERQRARSIQKEDTHLIETLRIRLEGALKAESNLKNLLLEEKQKSESLEACLNSARALESYIQSSTSDSESSQTKRNQLLLRIEVDRLKQMNSDLEDVISRERNYQASLKDKVKLLQFQNQSSEKQAEEMKIKLTQEIKLRESVENQLKNVSINPTIAASPKLDNEISSKIAMENVVTEIKQWKDECMQLRECVRLQREHEDYWAVNVQTPLIKQLNDVNRSLETLVREKITLQTYVNCIEKERDFLRSRVEKLEELNEKLSGTHLSPLPPQMSAKLNLQSLINKLQCFAELNHKMESHRKALIWQKRYLLIAINGYKKSTAETIGRLEPLSAHSQTSKRVSFRSVVHVISACIKFNYIYRRRKASRRVMVNRMKAEINMPTTPLNMRKNTGDIHINAGTSSISNNCMSLSPPSRDLYAVPRLVESSGPSVDSEPSKLSQYIAMFDQMQKRIGKIIQNENF